MAKRISAALINSAERPQKRKKGSRMQSESIGTDSVGAELTAPVNIGASTKKAKKAPVGNSSVPNSLNGVGVKHAETAVATLTPPGPPVAETPDLTGLQVYWHLATVDPVMRQKAAKVLLEELAVQQATYVAGDADEESTEVEGNIPGCSPALRYALRRLMRGLASSRGVRGCWDHSPPFWTLSFKWLKSPSVVFLCHTPSHRVTSVESPYPPKHSACT